MNVCSRYGDKCVGFQRQTDGQLRENRQMSKRFKCVGKKMRVGRSEGEYR